MNHNSAHRMTGACASLGTKMRKTPPNCLQHNRPTFSKCLMVLAAMLQMGVTALQLHIHNSHTKTYLAITKFPQKINVQMFC